MIKTYQLTVTSEEDLPDTIEMPNEDIVSYEKFLELNINEMLSNLGCEETVKIEEF